MQASIHRAACYMQANTLPTVLSLLSHFTCACFCFIKPVDTQGLHLAHSRTTHRVTQGIIWGAEYQSWVGCVQFKHLIHCTVSLAPLPILSHQNRGSLLNGNMKLNKGSIQDHHQFEYTYHHNCHALHLKMYWSSIV